MNRAALEFQENLKRKKRIPKRVGSVNHPAAVEREYFKDIQKNVIHEIIQAYRSLLLPRLKGVADNITETIPEVRNDTGEAELSAILGRVRLVIGQKLSADELRKIVKRNIEKVEDFNTKSSRRQFKRVADLNILAGNPQIESTVVLATMNNVSLITNLSQQAVTNVEQIVFEGFRTGKRWESIAQSIEAEFDDFDGKVSNRARLIARDQVSKLNGQLTEARQTGLGIKRYIWRTSRDERVRESHQALEGEEFSWDAPPSEGHPGEAINCRCTAEPVIESALE